LPLVFLYSVKKAMCKGPFAGQQRLLFIRRNKRKGVENIHKKVNNAALIREYTRVCDDRQYMTAESDRFLSGY
jgi:hypothetical protein